MKTVKDFENWTGMDVDTATSLFEYGLMILDDAPEHRLNIVRGVRQNDDGEYTHFEYTSCDWPDLLSNWPAVATFAGCTVSDLQVYNVGNLHTLIQYYGTEDILGSIYDIGFQIVEDIEDAEK